MKLLLTSSGLSNDILKSEFLTLLEKPAAETKVAFVDTAAKVQKNTGYVDEDINTLKSLGLKNITVVDIATPQDSWIKDFLQADLFFVEGGNTFYLMDKLRTANLDKSLPRIIQGKVYVGVSAGSIVATPDISVAGVEPGDSNDVGMTDFTGMSIVDFEVSPHTPDTVPLENIKKYAQTISNKVYAYDDNSAVKVINNEVAVVGGGNHTIFN